MLGTPISIRRVGYVHAADAAVLAILEPFSAGGGKVFSKTLWPTTFSSTLKSWRCIAVAAGRVVNLASFTPFPQKLPTPFS
jgi:hypothetical protein